MAKKTNKKKTVKKTAKKVLKTPAEPKSTAQVDYTHDITRGLTIVSLFVNTDRGAVSQAFTVKGLLNASEALVAASEKLNAGI